MVRHTLKSPEQIDKIGPEVRDFESLKDKEDSIEEELKQIALTLRRKADGIDARVRDAEKSEYKSDLSDAAEKTVRDLMWMLPNMHFDELIRDAVELREAKKYEMSKMPK